MGQSTPVCGDVNGSGTVSVTDALAVLRASVGQPADLQCPAPGVLTRTGQSMCWDINGQETACHGTGEDGELRTGIALDFTDNGDGTITDSATGLMWEKLGRNNSIHDVDKQFDWNDAFGKIATLNDDAFAGHEDWRIPNERELFSLVTFSGAADATIAGIFRNDCSNDCSLLHCSCTAAAAYWSSTTDPVVPARGLGVDFGHALTVSVDKNAGERVRAVRNAF